MKKIITLLLLLFSTMVACNSQTKQTMYQSAQNKTSSNISIESPIKAILNVYVDNENLIGEVSLTNISDKNVILNDKMIGGKTLNERVFFAKVLPLQPNLTFKRHSTFSDMIFGIEIEYVTIKPNQTIITKTKLNDYFNFREKKYDTLIILFDPKMPLYDENNEQVYQIDEFDHFKKPVDFYITSNNVYIKYEDIKDVKK